MAVSVGVSIWSDLTSLTVVVSKVVAIPVLYMTTKTWEQDSVVLKISDECSNSRFMAMTLVHGNLARTVARSKPKHFFIRKADYNSLFL